jgi:CO/xanthine dehydrogenase FAD-binding subunit
MLPEFELLMPQTLSEALDMLAQGAPDVVPVAGGTSLLVDMRGGLRQPGTLMNVAGLEELGTIRRENGHVVVGGGVTIAQLLDSPLVQEHAPILIKAAERFANPLVRNRATVGGNLAYASPAADTAPPLLVLNAEVELTSVTGSRYVPLRDFMTGVRKTARRPEELLTAVRWPVPGKKSADAYHKLALRKADAISVVSVAVFVEHEGETCGDVRIAMGAVAPNPIRAEEAEEALRGKPLTPETIEQVAHFSCEATCCIDDIRGSADYRKKVTRAIVRRLLNEIAEDVCQ